MAINKNLIHFKTKLKFLEELANGNILETSIVFILETTEIYTHGLFYDGSTFDPSNIEASIEDIINNKADKTELPTKTSDLTNDSGFITINDVSVGNLLKTYTFYVDNINIGSLGYTITQSELEEIQNADSVYIFIDSSKQKIQLTSKTENDSISFFGYNLNSYPSTVFLINVNIENISDNIEVLISIDSIGLDDYISENSSASYAAGVCLSEEFVNGAEITIVYNMDLIINSALSDFRPVVLMLMNSNNDKGVLLHGPYVLYSLNDILSIKFIGLFNDLTIECVLRQEDNYLFGTIHVKSQSEGGSVDLNGYATQEWVNEQGFLKDHQDISHLAEKSELPAKTSDLENDSGFITINDIPEEYVTETELSQKGFLVGVDTYETLDDVETNVYVKYVALTLTDELKALVRENIGALSASDLVTVDLSNYYTKEEINALLGDINTILESIINGGGQSGGV